MQSFQAASRGETFPQSVLREEGNTRYVGIISIRGRGFFFQYISKMLTRNPKDKSTTVPYEPLQIHLTHRVCDVNFIVLQVQNLQRTAAVSSFFICVVAVASQRRAEGRRTSRSNPGVVKRQRSKRGVPAKPVRERDRAVVAYGVVAQLQGAQSTVLGEASGEVSSALRIEPDGRQVEKLEEAVEL